MPITLDIRDHIATVTLNRPEKLNALDTEHLQQMREALAEADASPEVRVTVLTGAGDRAFCVGADLTAARADDIPIAQALGYDLRRATEAGLYIRLFNLSTLALRKPLIAVVNGHCLGGGLELALQCDFILASDTATFGLPEVIVGSLPGGGGVHNLLRAVPRSAAMRLMLTGEKIGAEQALAIGLICNISPAGRLSQDAQAEAARIAANAPLAVQCVKMLAGAASLPAMEAFQMTELAWGLVRDTSDRAEGRLAFAEKRAPVFHGR